jgi:mannose-6-phosphate isomerase-like protein (cupin superfamily)
MTEQATAAIDIHRLESEKVTRQYGLDFKLLHPWPGINAPFEGAWCVVRPGDVSQAHAHGEREILIGMSGRGGVVSDGDHLDFNTGDIVLLQAGITHSVVNNGDTDFAYYAIWWDRAMSAEYLAGEPSE